MFVLEGTLATLLTRGAFSRIPSKGFLATHPTEVSEMQVYEMRLLGDFVVLGGVLCVQLGGHVAPVGGGMLLRPLQCWTAPWGHVASLPVSASQAYQATCWPLQPISGEPAG